MNDGDDEFFTGLLWALPIGIAFYSLLAWGLL